MSHEAGSTNKKSGKNSTNVITNGARMTANSSYGSKF